MVKDNVGLRMTSIPGKISVYHFNLSVKFKQLRYVGPPNTIIQFSSFT